MHVLWKGMNDIHYWSKVNPNCWLNTDTHQCLLLIALRWEMCRKVDVSESRAGVCLFECQSWRQLLWGWGELSDKVVGFSHSTAFCSHFHILCSFLPYKMWSASFKKLSPPPPPPPPPHFKMLSFLSLSIHLSFDLTFYHSSPSSSSTLFWLVYFMLYSNPNQRRSYSQTHVYKWTKRHKDLRDSERKKYL